MKALNSCHPSLVCEGALLLVVPYLHHHTGTSPSSLPAEESIGGATRSVTGPSRPNIDVPGKNIAKSRRRSSSRPHCQTLRNSWARRTASPSAVLRKIRSHPRRPGSQREAMISKPKGKQGRSKKKAHLMCSANQIHVMFLQESRHHVRPERE